MTYAGWDAVGAEGQSYPEVAARAVQGVHAQHNSPFYGYIRSGMSQKIYLFPLINDARSWFEQHMQLQPVHDYAAVFSARDLRAPIDGMEHFMSATPGVPAVGCDPQVGNWWPFVLGLPLGGLGGYFLRRWQEPESARAQVPRLREAAQAALPILAPRAQAPQASGDPYVGGPWLDVVGQDYGGYGGYGGYGQDYGGDGYAVGGPWFDIVGAEADADAARRRSWPQTRALIQAATDEVKRYEASYPAEAFVWELAAPSPSPGRNVILSPTTKVSMFSSQPDALDYLRTAAQSRPVALAMFERSSRHWPNPTAWRKSDDPGSEEAVAMHLASVSPTQTSGTYLGTELDDQLEAVRRRAQSLADKRAGNVVGVIHTSKDKLWHTLAFRTADDADDWLNTATQDQDAYTYAAYFDKDGDSWPRPYIEKIGGFHTSKSSQRFPRRGIVGGDYSVGAAVDDYRSRAKQLASAKRGNAVGVILKDGMWHRFGFTSLDDTIDWLQAVTQSDKTSFTYAAAFEKGSDGTAYLQDEEIGRPRQVAEPGPLIRRGVATTSGERW